MSDVHAYSAEPAADRAATLPWSLVYIESSRLFYNGHIYSKNDALWITDTTSHARFPIRILGVGQTEVQCQRNDGSKTRIALASLQEGRYVLEAKDAQSAEQMSSAAEASARSSDTPAVPPTAATGMEAAPTAPPAAAVVVAPLTHAAGSAPLAPAAGVAHKDDTHPRITPQSAHTHVPLSGQHSASPWTHGVNVADRVSDGSDHSATQHMQRPFDPVPAPSTSSALKMNSEKRASPARIGAQG